MTEVTPPDFLTCATCLERYNSKLLPRILPCGHSLCSPCVDVIMSKPSSQCPLCRESPEKISKDCHYPVSYELNNIISHMCQDHFDIKSLYCFTCNKRICAGCYFCKSPGNDHAGHNVIHLLDIDSFHKEYQEKLVNCKDSKAKFLKAINVYWRLSKKKTHQKFKDTPHHDGVLFEAELFEKFVFQDAISLEKMSIEEIQERISILCNDRNTSSQVVETLGKEPPEFDSHQKLTLMSQKILSLEKLLESSPVLAFTPEDILQKSYFQVRRLIDYNTDSDTLSISPKNLNKNESLCIIKNPKKPRQVEIEVDKEDIDGTLNTTKGVLTLLNEQNQVSFSFIDKRITNDYMEQFQFLDFKVDAKMLRINLSNCYAIDDIGIDKLLNHMSSVFESIQELICDFKGTNISDKSLITIEEYVLKKLSNLIGFQLNLLETKVTNEGVSSLLMTIDKSRRGKSLTFEGEEVSFKNIREFVREKVDEEQTSELTFSSFGISLLEKQFSEDFIEEDKDNAALEQPLGINYSYYHEEKVDCSGPSLNDVKPAEKIQNIKSVGVQSTNNTDLCDNIDYGEFVI